MFRIFTKLRFKEGQALYKPQEKGGDFFLIHWLGISVST